MKVLNYAKLMRKSHWIKNILIVIPAFFGTALIDSEILFKLLIGFFVFSFCSSAIYIINDICDIENDRLHPVKCKRPLASGAVSKTEAYILLAVLLTLAFGLNTVICGFHSKELIPLVYLILNLSYSLNLKNRPVIDIVILVSGFFMRIFYGSVITDVKISGLLYLTVISFSLFLAYGKRRNEKISCGNSSRKVLRFYNERYLNSSMYMYLTLFMIFYAVWSLSLENSQVLIYTTPLIMVMSMRYTYRLEVDAHGNPVDMILHDKVLIMLGTVYMIIISVIIYFPEVYYEYLRL
ncbi:MAG: UbiA prenyltransferase family protein [Ruminococcus sp.]|nr:UbiA prenyltransferase family protein [Ruminococcus sp.]